MQSGYMSCHVSCSLTHPLQPYPQLSPLIIMGGSHHKLPKQAPTAIRPPAELTHYTISQTNGKCMAV